MPPGVEGQQLGVDQDEGVQHLLARSLCTAVELLHQAALQELDALLAQGRVDEPLHCLKHTRTRTEREREKVRSKVTARSAVSIPAPVFARRILPAATPRCSGRRLSVPDCGLSRDCALNQD